MMHVQVHVQQRDEGAMAIDTASGGGRADLSQVEPADAALIDAVRRGDVGAFGVLYERYLGVARRVAAWLSTSAAEREDLIAEAFTRVFRALRADGGPTEGFRGYLVTTMRNTVIEWRRRQAAVVLVADVPDISGPDDPVGKRAHATVAADAFASLPERWRVVLWHTEVEGRTPAQVAPLLGLTPNGVSALAYRAREGLRQAYLGVNLPDMERQACQMVVGRLASWVRRGCATGRTPQITRHLERCGDCSALADGILRTNEELPAVASAR